MPQTETTPTPIDELGDELSCQDRLRPFWESADIHPHLPAGTDEAVALLRHAGFDASVEMLEGWCRSGMITNCKIKAGKFAWMAQNIVAAMIHLDVWRRWIPLHAKHLHKMSAVELLEGEARLAGTTAFTDLETFDVNAFVEIMTRCQDPGMRATFGQALKTKLRDLGVLDK